MQSVLNGCKGFYACGGAGFIGGGSISSIVDVCMGYAACVAAAAYEGSIGSITSSCKEENAFNWLGYKYGKVGNILNSFIGSSACKNETHLYGSVGSITNSCDDLEACNSIGKFWRTVGNSTMCALHHIPTNMVLLVWESLGTLSTRVLK